MQGRGRLLYHILREADQLIIPIYQRNYDWTEKQCDQLFDDLIQLYKHSEDDDYKKYHFFGSIVYKRIYDERISFSLIDGQQRIVTVSLLLKAMFDIFKKDDDKKLLQEIEDLLKNPYTEKIRLKPCNADCDAYDSIIEDTYSNYGESRIIQNYKHLIDRINKSKTSLNISLKNLLDSIKKLEVIEILLEDRDDAQIIFESLNSTGLALKESDKIRNKILMNRSEAEQTYLYTRYWLKIENCCKKLNFEQFIRDYFTILLGKIPNKSELYSEFKSKYDNISTYGSKYDFKDLEELLKDMLKYGEIYRDIYEGNIGEKYTNKVLKRLYSLNQFVITPYIMQLIDYKTEGNLEESEMRDILVCIETYIFRRAICNIPTNDLNKFFCVLHNNIIKQKENSEFSYIDILKYEFIKRKLPNDELFKNNFKENDIYNLRNIKPYIFTQLENKLREKNKDNKEMESLDIENFDIRTIEHIMPQKLNSIWEKELGSNFNNIHEIYLNRISNLTITNYNPTLSNKPFSLKLKDDNAKYDYNRSGYELTRKTIVDKINNEWDCISQEDRGAYFEVFLKSRGDYLADIASERWEMLKTQYKPEIKEEKEEKEVLLIDEYDFTNVKVKAFTLFDETINVDNMADMLVKIIKMLYKKDSDIVSSEIRNDIHRPFILDKKGRELIKNEKRESAIKPIVEDFIYVYTGTDSNTKINQLKILFDKYKLKYGEDEINQVSFTIIESTINKE